MYSDLNRRNTALFWFSQRHEIRDAKNETSSSCQNKDKRPLCTYRLYRVRMNGLKLQKSGRRCYGSKETGRKGL